MNLYLTFTGSIYTDIWGVQCHRGPPGIWDSSRVTARVSGCGYVLYVTLSTYSPLMYLKRLLLSYHPCWGFLLDDSVCSLFWLCLVTGLQCAVWVSGCVTTDCNGWTLQGRKPLQPAYIYTLLCTKIQKKTHDLRHFNQTRQAQILFWANC